MAEVRRILIIFVVAILLSIFIFTTIDAFYPSPQYSDYCDNRYIDRPYFPGEAKNNCTPIATSEELNSCYRDGGEPRYEYGEDGCEVSWTCDYCGKDYEDIRKSYNLIRSLIATLLGFIAIVIGLFLPQNKNEVHEWVGSGLMLGGIVTIFIATAIYFSDLHRWLRPLVILGELILVIYLAYRRLSPKTKKK